MLCSAKVNANAESCVGLMTLAGRSTTMLITSTRDLSRVFNCLHDIKFDGNSDFVAGIQKAQLALKHRQNAHQRQRVVVFITSPILVDTEQLVRLGKNLKKNNVAVDVINIGMEGENKEKIDAFIGAVNSGDNSRSLHVDAGSENLVKALMGSDIYIERDGVATPVGDVGGAAGASGSGDASEFPYGVDPSVDPELAMVLRISMEEERARQAAAREAEERKAAEEARAEDENKEGGDSGAGSSKMGGNYDDNDEDLYGTGVGQMDVDIEGDEEEMLRAAIELSKKEAEELEKKEKEGEK